MSECMYRYIGVGAREEIQLFYYFIKSERDAEKDSLMLWLTGGPGCSAFSGLIYEIGKTKHKRIYGGLGFHIRQGLGHLS